MSEHDPADHLPADAIVLASGVHQSQGQVYHRPADPTDVSAGSDCGRVNTDRRAHLVERAEALRRWGAINRGCRYCYGRKPSADQTPRPCPLCGERPPDSVAKHLRRGNCDHGPATDENPTDAPAGPAGGRP